MSQMVDAWSSLYEAQTEAIGAQVVTVGATANIPAIIEEIPLDLAFADGTMAEAQSFNIQLLATSLASVEPPKYTAVSFTPIGTGTAYAGKVLSVRNNNGIFYLLVGDPNKNP